MYKAWNLVLDQIKDKKTDDSLINIECDELVDVGVRCENPEEVLTFYKNFLKICETNIEWVCSNIRSFKVLVKPGDLLLYKKSKNLHLELEIALGGKNNGTVGAEFLLVDGPVHEFYLLQSMIQKELCNIEA